MIIHYYAVCWNEARIIPHFLRYYSKLADKIILADDGSTDGSVELVGSHNNVEVKGTGRPDGQSFIDFNHAWYNQAWKQSRDVADWVIVGNLDEFIFHPDLRDYLGQCLSDGVTVVPVLGFQMLGEHRIDSDQDLFTSYQFGAPFSNMSKYSIFRPDEITEINYGVGRHTAAPTGNLVMPAEDLVLNLHYKYIDKEYLVGRHRAQNARRIAKDIERGYGHRYGFSNEMLEKDWQAFAAKSFNVFNWYASDQPYPLARRWREN